MGSPFCAGANGALGRIEGELKQKLMELRS